MDEHNESTQYWYGSFSTGIFEIDNQHGNIDILIQLLSHDDDNNIIDKFIELRKAISSHFEFEQNLLDDKFPKDHYEAHQEFLETIDEQFKLVSDGILHIDQLVRFLRTGLVTHVQEFDIKIKDHLI